MMKIGLKMWPFKKKKIEVVRRKYIDWSKVKTTDDLVLILSGLNLLQNVKVDECFWDDPKWKNLLGTTVVETTYVDGLWYSQTEVKDEPNRDLMKGVWKS